MKRKTTTKPRFLLLDANIVIEAYKLRVWDELLRQVHISVPSLVINDEALFYIGGKGIPEEINLRRLVEEGSIEEVQATVGEINALTHLFDRAFVESIHEGEGEALALIYSDRLPDYKFCTGDAAAIRGLALIDKADNGVSFEEVLTSVGLNNSLRVQYTKKFFMTAIERGCIMRIQKPRSK